VPGSDDWDNASHDEKLKMLREDIHRLGVAINGLVAGAGDDLQRFDQELNDLTKAVEASSPITHGRWQKAS
jgi:hypothetical protein